MSERKQSVTRFILSVKPWWLVILTVVSLIICVAALRSNNEHMIQLRNQVYAADKNNGDIQGALYNLQKYVTTHMNTNLSSGPNAVYPPIQLKYTYNRLISKQTQNYNQQNANLYTQAEQYCQSKVPNGFSGRYRVPCIEQYVTSHGLKASSVNQSLYEFDFVSPSWSPDLAGWSELATIFFGLLLLIRLATKALAD